MTTHMDHHTENSQLSFPLTTSDNTVNYVRSCNYTSITNTCLSRHRGGCWKQTGMKKLEEVENILRVLSTGVMHFLPESALRHPWIPLSVLPVGTLLALKHWRAATLRMHSGHQSLPDQRPKLHSPNVKPVVYNISSIILKLHSCTMSLQWSYISHKQPVAKNTGPAQVLPKFKSKTSAVWKLHWLRLTISKLN